MVTAVETGLRSVRVRIEISVCEHYGGSVRVLACIEDPDVIPDKAGGAAFRQALRRILDHLGGVGRKGDLATPVRGPPQLDFFA